MDDLNTGVSLETPALVTEPAPQTAPPPADTPVQAQTPPVTPPPAASEEPEGTVEGQGGQKFVPLAALQAERGKRKDLEAERETLRDKASKYDEAAQYLQQAKPYIEKAKQDLLKQQQPPAPKDDRAEVYAKRFDLYTTEGKPDVERAQAILKDQDEQMQRIAQQAVAPILQTEAQRQSAAQYQHFLQQPEVNGVKVDARLLAETWNSVPPEVSADPRVAQVLFMNTIGRQILSGHKPALAPPPPVVPTESVGSGQPSDVRLSSIDEKFMRGAQMPEKRFRETREMYKPGQSNSLE